MRKQRLDKSFVLESFSLDTTVNEYKQAVDLVGLWESEKLLFRKYISKSHTILDIGCGAGRTTFGLYKLGYENIIGIDFSNNMILAANDIAKSKDVQIKFEVQDACNLSLKSDSFDIAIFSFTGLTQIPKRENRIKAIREINRVLKKGGVFIFSTHDRDDPEFQDYWEDEANLWKDNKQDKRLEMFGDRIILRGKRNIEQDETSIKTCTTLEELKREIKQYMTYYNHFRYQWNLKKMTPVQYRDHLLKIA